jgi:hypothetical protein
MGLLIAGVWMMALFSGGVLTLGLIALATGRAPFNLAGHGAWTRSEGRKLGAVWTVVGATYAAYGLLGGVALAIEYETQGTNPLIGHWWGLYVPMIPGLVLIGGLLMQLEIYNRHRRRLREGR